MKIAVTSSDGKNIDRHFGKAETIFVFDIDGNGIKYLEKRNIEKYCSDDPKHSFRAEEFEKVYQALHDCEILYTEKIGTVPAERCKSMGIKVKQMKGKIISVIEK